MQDFLPVTKKEMKQRGWEQVDFAYITGDAYVDQQHKDIDQVGGHGS